jgi:hypothetical protein
MVMARQNLDASANNPDNPPLLAGVNRLQAELR